MTAESDADEAAADRPDRPDATDDSAGTMRGRAGESRLKLWLLLRANRLVVAGALTVLVFVVSVAIAAGISPSLAAKVEAKDPIETLFSAMITAIVTGATLVVTIGQLVLTQENGPLGDQRDRMDGALAVRETVAELLGSPAPTNPASFLDALLGVASERADALRESVRDRDAGGTGETDRPDEPALREDVDELASSVGESADAVRDRLDGTRFGSFDVVFAALDFPYGREIAHAERVAADHGEALTDDERDLLGDLTEALSLFGPAREHVKTLYFQWALIDLSRLILYAAVPALVVAGAMVAVVDVGTFPGRTLGVDHLTLVVAGAFAVTLLPFSLFVSYVVRVLTLAKRTLAIGPLVLRDTE
ncbi:hypothetical protein DJ82_13185 [Halorubrum sp. Ib24]|uniref:hypothetical protein n=1 Tax=unclassified Halorubrum TaxID=2642239 RepID=UPI000B985563|nr:MULTISPECIES: hypothetical protein [unclassified Halorubrum]OYR38208.1 hypothetical protein DJ82_13185 [Halorubrum sp. Ib24]OYR55979.1 hypothetical protein DJ73_00860 [Halorubrum sp. Ea1]